MLMHPGSLVHKSVPVTSGSRAIMVGFTRYESAARAYRYHQQPAGDGDGDGDSEAEEGGGRECEAPVV